MFQRNNKKSFTLAELLIVVAIIAVLVAIAIPVFTSQLEKSREATDQANIRSLYAETVAVVLGTDLTYKTEKAGSVPGSKIQLIEETGGYTGKATIPLNHQKAGFEGGVTKLNIGGVDITVSETVPAVPTTAYIEVYSDGTAPYIGWTAKSGGGSTGDDDNPGD